MAEKTRNLCAEIPLELHTKVRQRQAESGETLSRYMTALITKCEDGGVSGAHRAV